MLNTCILQLIVGFIFLEESVGFNLIDDRFYSGHFHQFSLLLCIEITDSNGFEKSATK